MKQKRDNRYFLERLRLEHPHIHADYQAGKFRNATEAFRAAGLVKTRSALERLEKAWNEASAAERDAFKMRIGCTASTGAPGAILASGGGGVAGAPTTPPVTRSVSLVTHPVPGRHPSTSSAHVSMPNQPKPGRGQLTDDERTAVREIMDRRGMRVGDVMRELGRKPLDASLGMALHRGTTLTADLLDLLRSWIETHRKS
ncbi:hypothetical protein [Phaeovulum vinaykumarii]|uniref:hypothetical protein n=1 Tax=Phaeovulum vinaykumarii TaxID=407234 RepID=UPI0009706E41|nr:hypothetical protein [Phaeovulum vinaykumarii]